MALNIVIGIYSALTLFFCWVSYKLYKLDNVPFAFLYAGVALAITVAIITLIK